jgi:hypothetical protein
MISKHTGIKLELNSRNQVGKPTTKRLNNKISNRTGMEGKAQKTLSCGYCCSIV